jgi:hypothetical protein
MPTLSSGTISGNNAKGVNYAEGGGVAVHKGTFIMEGEEISGNGVNGSVNANGGGDIGSTNDTLVAIPKGKR